MANCIIWHLPRSYCCVSARALDLASFIVASISERTYRTLVDDNGRAGDLYCPVCQGELLLISSRTGLDCPCVSGTIQNIANMYSLIREILNELQR